MLKPTVNHAVNCAPLLLVVLIAWSSFEAPRSAAAEPKATKLQALLQERLATLREVAAQTIEQYRVGRMPFFRVQQAMEAAVSAELDLCASDKERITVLEKALAQAKEFQGVAEARLKTGMTLNTEVLMAKAARLDVEIALERLRSKAADRPR